MIHPGHCIDLLRAMPPASAHCCVTSPPYYALRDYGIPPVRWEPVAYRPMAGLPEIIIPEMTCSLGLEPGLESYIGHVVAVFREVKRVLRGDGTAWVNLGDKYNCKPVSNGKSHRRDRAEVVPRLEKPNPSGMFGAKEKDIMGIPWRCALALQADGWWLRTEIVWHKPNAMPESARDRPCRDHEYVFLLSKSPRYYYDGEAIKEPQTGNAHAPRAAAAMDLRAAAGPNVRRLSVPQDQPDQPDSPDSPSSRRALAIKSDGSFHQNTPLVELPGGRNKRTVWTIMAKGTDDAHFATYPPELVRPCILAGTSAFGACAKCAAPFERLTAPGAPDRDWQRRCGANSDGSYKGAPKGDYGANGAETPGAVKARILAGMVAKKTLGWEPSCKCAAAEPPEKCVVLDPFSGSGTTAVVALELGRDFVGCEIKPEYRDISTRRLATITGGLRLL